MNEPHQRFDEWLTAGADGEPPRDAAVHASVCASCRQSIVALDLLANVNTGLAAMPAEPTGRERGRLGMAGRLVGATAILFGAATLGVGVSQLVGVSPGGGPVAQASPTLEQSVLAETAAPSPSPAQETLTPLGTPGPTHAPPAVTPVPGRTAAPTPIVTPIVTPIPTESGTPLESTVPTPTPTPVPSASEPVPSASEPVPSASEPVPSASASPSASEPVPSASASVPASP